MSGLKVELKWAFVFFILLLVWLVFGRLIGIDSVHIERHAAYSSLFTIPAFGIYVLALLEKRKRSGGRMSYREGVATGMKLTLLLVALSLITPSIATAISPGYYAHAARHAVESGAMSSAEAENFFTLGKRTELEVVTTLVYGSIFSLFIAVFTRRSGSALHTPSTPINSS